MLRGHDMQLPKPLSAVRADANQAGNLFDMENVVEGGVNTFLDSVSRQGFCPSSFLSCTLPRQTSTLTSISFTTFQGSS